MRFSQCPRRVPPTSFPVTIKAWHALLILALLFLVFLLVFVHLSFVLMAHVLVPNVPMYNRKGIVTPLAEIEDHMMSHIKAGRVCFGLLHWSFLLSSVY